MIARTVFFAISLFMFFCTRNQSIEGDWSVSYLNAENMSKSEFFFNDFDLYHPVNYIPIIHIDKDSLKYGLGFGMSKRGLSNAYKYFLSNKHIKIVSNNIEQSFQLNFISDSSFCLFEGKLKVVCFSRYKKPNKCTNYLINLKISNEYYNHELFINEKGEYSLFRAGVKSDSIYSILNQFENEELKYLVSLLDFELNESNYQFNSGDYTEYLLSMKCGKENISRKFRGAQNISFGMRSLLMNLEKLSKSEYSQSRPR